MSEAVPSRRNVPQYTEVPNKTEPSKLTHKDVVAKQPHASKIADEVWLDVIADIGSMFSEEHLDINFQVFKTKFDPTAQTSDRMAAKTMDYLGSGVEAYESVATLKLLPNSQALINELCDKDKASANSHIDNETVIVKNVGNAIEMVMPNELRDTLRKEEAAGGEGINRYIKAAQAMYGPLPVNITVVGMTVQSGPNQGQALWGALTAKFFTDLQAVLPESAEPKLQPAAVQKTLTQESTKTRAESPTQPKTTSAKTDEGKQEVSKAKVQLISADFGKIMNKVLDKFVEAAREQAEKAKADSLKSLIDSERRKILDHLSEQRRSAPGSQPTSASAA